LSGTSTRKKPLPYEENHKLIDGILHKRCYECEDWFPCTLEFFYKSESSTKDKLNCMV